MGKNIRPMLEKTRGATKVGYVDEDCVILLTYNGWTVFDANTKVRQGTFSTIDQAKRAANEIWGERL